MDKCKTYQLAKHVGNDVDTDAAYAMLADVILRSVQHDEDETEFNDYLLHHYPMDKERLKNCVAALSIIRVKSGETIMKAGEDSSFIAFLLKGSFQAEGSNRKFRPGDVIGATDYFERKQRKKSVKCISNNDSVIGVLLYDEMDELRAAALEGNMAAASTYRTIKLMLALASQEDLSGNNMSRNVKRKPIGGKPQLLNYSSEAFIEKISAKQEKELAVSGVKVVSAPLTFMNEGELLVESGKDAKEKIDKADQDIIKLRQELAETRKKSDEYKSAVENLKAQLKRAENDYNDVQRMKETTNAQLREMVVVNTELKSEISQLDGHCKKLENQVKDLRVNQLLLRTDKKLLMRLCRFAVVNHYVKSWLNARTFTALYKKVMAVTTYALQAHVEGMNVQDASAQQATIEELRVSARRRMYNPWEDYRENRKKEIHNTQMELLAKENSLKAAKGGAKFALSVLMKPTFKSIVEKQSLEPPLNYIADSVWGECTILKEAMLNILEQRKRWNEMAMEFFNRNIELTNQYQERERLLQESVEKASKSDMLERHLQIVSARLESLRSHDTDTDTKATKKLDAMIEKSEQFRLGKVVELQALFRKTVQLKRRVIQQEDVLVAMHNARMLEEHERKLRHAKQAELKGTLSTASLYGVQGNEAEKRKSIGGSNSSSSKSKSSHSARGKKDSHNGGDQGDLNSTREREFSLNFSSSLSSSTQSLPSVSSQGNPNINSGGNPLKKKTATAPGSNKRTSSKSPKKVMAVTAVAVTTTVTATPAEPGGNGVTGNGGGRPPLVPTKSAGSLHQVGQQEQRQRQGQGGLKASKTTSSLPGMKEAHPASGMTPLNSPVTDRGSPDNIKEKGSSTSSMKGGAADTQVDAVAAAAAAEATALATGKKEVGAVAGVGKNSRPTTTASVSKPIDTTSTAVAAATDPDLYAESWENDSDDAGLPSAGTKEEAKKDTSAAGSAAVLPATVNDPKIA